tara:strand:- start:1117 stop:1269 length:153 start_codon:yes stop_codon:yes gene_type:complete
MNSFKDSVILMGIDWSKAAKLEAMEVIKVESPRIAKVIDDLDDEYRKDRL